jgi:preprotein translocase subunit SecD
MNNKKLWGFLALIPFVLGTYFVTTSEQVLYDRFEIIKNSVPFIKNFPFRLGLDLSSGVRLTYNADLSKVEEKDKPEALSVLRDVIERRVNAFGVSEPVVQIESSVFSNENRMLVELPGLTNVEQAIKLIGETPTLEFKLERAINASSSEFKSIGLDGRSLKKSQLVFDQSTGRPEISLEWNDAGRDLFATTTSNNIGKALGIFLDGQMISAPRINSAITDGKAIISGGFTREEAKILSGRLNTGALPVPVKIVGSEVVEPLLGSKALNAGLMASLYGFLAIIIMLILYYRVPGIVGAFSLLSYVAIVLSIFKFIPVTLSAAAIAGFIISIGLAVDGNILIFERLKEELARGKKKDVALDDAFGRAWTSIRDSNLASLIAAIILFFIGTSVVQGFALTLMIGVLVSMFSSVVVTRWILRLIIINKK